jgi:hypothetical protein
MNKAIGIFILVLLAGCSALPERQLTVSPCAVSEASMACQVERYNNVSGN